VGALVLSAPLVSALVLRPEAAIAGMLLFQMTMPVTLKAFHHLLPGRPALAFGVPCLALFLGSLPGLERIRLLDSWPEALATVLASAALIAVGLLLLGRAGGSVGPRRTLTRAAGPPRRMTPC
jgi:FSR family fosmidomycin resistance protein-like MFS transporter